ncbi:MAG: hypothetical protein AAB624_00440 [Patescibacteria group bacterium]
MVSNFRAAVSERAAGVALDVQTSTGLDLSELTPTTRESAYVVAAVGGAAVLTLVTMTIKHTCKRAWDKDGDTSVGWPERFDEREAEAITRERNESAARKIAFRTWWAARREPSITIPYMLGGMVGSFLRRPVSISDEESL